MDTNQIIAGANIVSVIVAILLTAITAWYAFQTKLMVDEMKEGRIKSAMPLVVAEVKIDLTKQDHMGLVGKFNIIVIKNIGTSYADKTNIELRLINPGTSTHKIDYQQWHLGILGLGDERNVIMNPCELKIPSTEQPRIEISISYLNSYGIEAKTISVFELQDVGTGPIDIKERANWARIDETIEAITKK